MPIIPNIQFGGDEVQARLFELGLSSELLRTAVLAGELGRSFCTANDPPAFAGITGWAVTVRALREELVPLGWRKNDGGNYSRVISPESVAIVVATGDENTGVVGANPKTKAIKGPATVRAIEANVAQVELFPEFAEAEVSVEVEDASLVTWVLLIHRAEGETRCELSMPLQMGLDGRIEHWAERLILLPIGLDDSSAVGGPQNGPAPGPEFDVEVIRKQG